jgi:beta-glucanase (GH16 family)
MDRRAAILPALALGVAIALVVAPVVHDDHATTARGAEPARAHGLWRLDHHDDFSGPRLDPARWTPCYWWDRGGCTNLGNDEAQWYVPSGIAQDHGVLRLTARAAASRHLGRSFPYSSGMVSSGRSGDAPSDAARYAFTYGSVEVRFRTPAGAGLWPAIWMLPVTNGSLPEIDLLEQYGDDTRLASMTLHTRGPEGGRPRVERHYERGADLSAGWHTVGLEWTPGLLRWFLDGTERFRVEGDRVPSQPMYLLIDLAVGGPAGDPDPSAFPASLLIDDVKVWRQA